MPSSLDDRPAELTGLSGWVDPLGANAVAPIDALLDRDLARFEDAVDELPECGFVLGSGSD
jgi:hypothetical protein